MEGTGAKIKRARREAGLSLDRLAERIGSSRRHLIRLEKGDHEPRPATLARIAEATGKPLDYFADDDEEESQVVREWLEARYDIAALLFELDRIVERVDLLEAAA